MCYKGIFDIKPISEIIKTIRTMKKHQLEHGMYCTDLTKEQVSQIRKIADRLDIWLGSDILEVNKLYRNTTMYARFGECDSIHNHKCDGTGVDKPIKISVEEFIQRLKGEYMENETNLSKRLEELEAKVAEQAKEIDALRRPNLKEPENLRFDIEDDVDFLTVQGELAAWLDRRASNDSIVIDVSMVNYHINRDDNEFHYITFTKK